MSTQSSKVSVFLPCRAGSQRVKNKNTRPFSKSGESLLTVKLAQLLNCDLVSEIVLSTNDRIAIKQANQFNSNKIIIHERCDELSSSNTTTDDLIKLVPNIINGHIMWTHVTSPLVNHATYDEMIEEYFNHLCNYDSLMSVTVLRKFIWDECGPYNYDASSINWPFTQNLKKLYEINSACFISSSLNYIKYSNRIGLNPFLFNLDSIQSTDVDHEDDFRSAAIVYDSIK